jgi:hypothetical protein
MKKSPKVLERCRRSAQRKIRRRYLPAVRHLEDRVLPANILVSTDGAYPQQHFREYTTAGVLVRSVNIPPGGTAEDARDLAADSNGNVLFYNGTFSPYLSTYNAHTGAWAHQTHAGWSTVNNVSYGGLALFGDYAFVTDMSTAGATDKGIVRFNRIDGTSTRFAGSTEFIDLTIGLDGKLYGLAGNSINVYDPVSTVLERTVTLPTLLGGVTQDYRAIAVNNYGDIYAATWNEDIHRFFGSGTYWHSTTLSAPSFYDLTDIDASADGKLLVGARSGHVVQLTQALTGATYFSTGTKPVFVAFGPEPALPPPLPTLDIGNTSVTEGNSGTVNATFTVVLSAPSAQSVTVNYATQNGTAQAGSDYLAGSGTITFSSGQTSRTITVAVIGDTVDETTESFYVNLSSPTYASINDGQGLSWLYDDDDAPRIYITDVTQAEGNSGNTSANFLVTLSTSWAQTITVNYTTTASTASAGSDYISTSGTLTFAPGETSKTISVSIIGDTISEGNETYYIDLSSPVNATLGDFWGYGTITNDDGLAPTLSVNDVTVVEGNSGTTLAHFTVSLSSAAAGTVTVNYYTSTGTATSGSDFTSTSGSLTFAPGELTKTIAVGVLGDLVGEANEYFYLNLQSPAGATISDYFGFGNITNDDGPPITISVNDVSVTEGNSGTSLANFTVTLSGASAVPVTLSYYTSGGTASSGSDYTYTTGSLSFAPGETSKTVSVSIIGDTLVENNETFSLYLYSAVNATFSDSSGMGTIITDDIASLSISDVSIVEGHSGLKYAVFNVSLSPSSAQTVTVSWATAAGTATGNTDYQTLSGSLTFSAGQTLKTVSIGILGDNTNEADETFFVNLSGASNAAIADAQGLGIIRDDDTIRLSVGDISITEGNSGSQSVVFTISLSQATDLSVTVNYYYGNGPALHGDDFTFTNGSLTFAPGETQKTVTGFVLGDLLDELDESFGVYLTNPVNANIGDWEGRCTIIDNDTATINVSDFSVYEGNSGTSYATFVVNLTHYSDRTITVNYATAGGAATAGVDFGNVSGALTYLAGQASKVVYVPVYGDVIDEFHETYGFTLSNAFNAVIGDGIAQGTIWDDDTSLASIGDATAIEGNNGSITVSFNVTLSLAADRAVTMNWATANGTATAPGDYDAAGALLTFDIGQTSKTMSVTVYGDTLTEGDETFYVNLTDILGVLAGDTQGLGTIINDDGNSPPIADLGVETVYVGEMDLASFSGSNSYDPDYQPLTFFWEFGDGHTQQGGMAAGHHYSDNGTYTLTLTVTDSMGAWSTDTLTVHVSNIAPIAGMSGPTDFAVNQIVSFFLNAWDPSAVDMNAPMTFQVNWGDGTNQTYEGYQWTYAEHAYGQLGNYTISLTATDKDQGTSFVVNYNVRVWDVLLNNGDLYVGGSASDDDIFLRAVHGGYVTVFINEVEIGTYMLGISGPGQGGVIVFAGAGNDHVFLMPPLGEPYSSDFPYYAALFGGDGNDELDAIYATKPVIVSGGAGNDFVLGGRASDVLIGGHGFDSVLGGEGGSAGSDLMISDATDYDNNFTGLVAIWAEWIRTDISFEMRRAHLDGSQAGGANGGYVLNASTVHTDGIQDSMSEGDGDGQDWFIMSGDGPLDWTFYEDGDDVITIL